MNWSGRPSTPPLALISLPNSSHARLACVPYCALLPDSAEGRPTLIGSAAAARRRKTGAPSVAPIPPAAAMVKNSRRVVLIVVPRLSIGLMVAVAPTSDRSHYRKAAIIGRHRACEQGDGQIASLESEGGLRYTSGWPIARSIEERRGFADAPFTRRPHAVVQDSPEPGADRTLHALGPLGPRDLLRNPRPPSRGASRPRCHHRSAGSGHVPRAPRARRSGRRRPAPARSRPRRRRHHPAAELGGVRLRLLRLRARRRRRQPDRPRLPQP